MDLDEGSATRMLNEIAEHMHAARTADDADRRRHEVQAIVRSATWLWAELNPDFDREAWSAVSFMLDEHWERIVEHQAWAYGQGQLEPPPADDTERIHQVCERLRREPLIGQRELLHSNVIAWLVDNHRDIARHVFEGWSRPEPDHQDAPTERERFNLDLVLHLERLAPLVIENKVFSQPDEAQLAGYTAKANAHYQPPPEYVLLSLSDPGWVRGEKAVGGAVWRHRSYGDLGASLELAAKQVKGRGNLFARETLARYAKLAQGLHDIAQIVSEIDDQSTVAMPAEYAADLATIGMTQGFDKVRARAIANRLNRTGDGAVAVGYSRGTPLIEWFAPVKGTDDEIGWQYQQGQWRLAVKVGSADNGNGRSPRDREVREGHVADNYQQWFDFADHPALGDTTRPAKTWGAFAPGFVYRYRTTTPDFTYAQLADLHHAAIARARALFVNR